MDDVSNFDYCKLFIGTPEKNGNDAGAVMSSLAHKVNLYVTLNMLEAIRGWQEASSPN